MNGLGSKRSAWVHLTESEEGRVREKDTEQEEEEALRRLRVRGMEFGVKLWFGSGHSLMVVVVVMECCVVNATAGEECSCTIFFLPFPCPLPLLSFCFIFCLIFYLISFSK